MQKIKEFFSTHKTLAEVIRFLIVGGLATVIDFFVMSLFVYAFNAAIYQYNLFNVFFTNAVASSWSVVVGTGLGFIISLIFNYLLSISFVFKENKFAKTKQGMLLFVILAIAGLLIHTVFMWLGYDILHINQWVVKIFLTIVVLIFNYITRKKIIFKKQESEKDEIKI